MDHEHLDPKGFFQDREDSFLNEFSKIFYDNNLQSFAKATDLGFLDFGKLPESDFTEKVEDFRGSHQIDNTFGKGYLKGEVSPFLSRNLPNTYSPLRITQQQSFSPVVNYTSFATMGNGPQRPQYQDFSQAYSPYKVGGHDYPYYEYADQPVNYYEQNFYDGYNQQYNYDPQQISLMWSNEAKGLRNVPVEEPQAPPQLTLSKKFSISSDSNAFKKPTGVKIEQDFDKITNKTMGVQLERVSERISKPSPAVSTPTMTQVALGDGPRRTTRAKKPLFSTNNMANNDESGSDDDKDDDGDSKNRSSRGLRVLSQKVREIVSRKKKTSYKEVADALLQDLAQKLKGKSQAEISKEEQNVKRRVYDALNVLIAAEILRKEGKLVCCEPLSSTRGGDQGKRKQRSNRDSILEKIEEVRRRRNEKVDNLQQLVLKSLALKNLIRRNKEKLAVKQYPEEQTNSFAKVFKHDFSSPFPTNATRIDVNQENNAPMQLKSEDTISFPFIVLVSSSPENNINLNMSASQRQLDIESTKSFNIFGDIDILLKMKLQYVPKEIFQREIPRELQKFVSQPQPFDEK